MVRPLLLLGAFILASCSQQTANNTTASADSRSETTASPSTSGTDANTATPAAPPGVKPDDIAAPAGNVSSWIQPGKWETTTVPVSGRIVSGSGVSSDALPPDMKPRIETSCITPERAAMVPQVPKSNKRCTFTRNNVSNKRASTEMKCTSPFGSLTSRTNFTYGPTEYSGDIQTTSVQKSPNITTIVTIHVTARRIGACG